MKIHFIEKYVLWYIRKFCKNDFIHYSEIDQAIKDAKLNENKRVNLIRDDERDDRERHHNLEIKLIKAESSAEMERINAEMNIMFQKVKRAQEVYYDVTQKAKITDSVIADMSTQARNLRDMMSSITGCIEGIENRTKKHVKDIADAEGENRQKLSLSAKE